MLSSLFALGPAATDFRLLNATTKWLRRNDRMNSHAVEAGVQGLDDGPEFVDLILEVDTH
jgi:hypothetical protein